MFWSISNIHFPDTQITHFNSGRYKVLSCLQIRLPLSIFSCILVILVGAPLRHGRKGHNLQVSYKPSLASILSLYEVFQEISVKIYLAILLIQTNAWGLGLSWQQVIKTLCILSSPLLSSDLIWRNELWPSHVKTRNNFSSVSVSVLGSWWKKM